MRLLKLETTVPIDPRRHFLVVLTPESLQKRPLDVPIFAIVEGRHGRAVECRSAEGREILRTSRNVLYVGITNIFGTPVRNATLLAVLEGLLANLPHSPAEDAMRECIAAHIAELTLPKARAVGADAA
jgi:hypothetical protein